MTSGVKVVEDRRKAVFAAFRVLVKDRVLVGIPADKAFRTPGPEDPTPHLNNAEIGYLNEFGAPEANIPARPHLVPGVQNALPQITKLYRAAVTRAAAGDIKGIREIEAEIGFTATSSVKDLIGDGIAPKLADSTVKDRKRRGRTGTTPLLDTGQYRRNIDFVVSTNGKAGKRGKR